MKRYINPNLSPREREVALLVPTGLSDREIGEALVPPISYKTVKFHLVMVYKRLGISNRVQLTVEILKGRLANNSPLGRGEQNAINF